MVSQKVNKLFGVCGILTLVVSILSLILSIRKAPWFNWTEYAISDLGTPEGAFTFFNNSVIAVGILLLIFSVGLVIFLGDRIGPTISWSRW